MMIKKAGKGLNIPVIPSRMSMLTKKINDHRQACFYCGQCSRGCMVYGDFSASSVLVIPAMKTGNLTLINNAMAREVLTDPNTGLSTGVSYVDKMTMEEKAEPEAKYRAFDEESNHIEINAQHGGDAADHKSFDNTNPFEDEEDEFV